MKNFKLKDFTDLFGLKGFWRGALFAYFLLLMHQDYLGKEGYIERVNHGWVDISWYFWLIPIALVMLSFVKNLFIEFYAHLKGEILSLEQTKSELQALRPPNRYGGFNGLPRVIDIPPLDESVPENATHEFFNAPKIHQKNDKSSK